MRTIGNILWLLIVGWLSFLGWVVAGAILCITIIGIPFGIQCFKLGVFSLWPFGRSTVRRPGVRVMGTVANVFWAIFFGIWLAIGYVVTGAILCITIIGIPFGIQAFKLAGLAVVPFGREIVPSDDRNRFA
jgi:uncharacterized membrane protein YccF (DUF307 family)